MDLEFERFVRIPFQVKAVQITNENMKEISKLIGWKIRTKNDGSGEKFIVLNRKIVSNMPRAFVGWYVTRMGDNYRVYAPEVFEAQFITGERYLAFEFSDDDEDRAIVLRDEEGENILSDGDEMLAALE